jgi:hypothetical protein
MNLIEIDDIFTETRLNLEKLIKQYDFVPQFEFILNKHIDYSLLDSLDFPGIYKIEIKTPYKNSDFNQWLNKFREEWEKAEYKDKFVPNIKKKRLNAHSNLTEWIPIYIGKSRKIKNRIKEHIDLKLSRPTTALKLLERINLYGNNFRISTISISVKNYDLIVSEFENYFREKVNPILGRK